MIKTPMQYENLKSVLQQGTVSSYDGFRLVVQKQLNLNTVVSHFYWIGSQAAGQIYQYRIILPIDDGKLINVSSDGDLSVEGEIKLQLSKNIGARSNFVVKINKILIFSITLSSLLITIYPFLFPFLL